MILRIVLVFALILLLEFYFIHKINYAVKFYFHRYNRKKYKVARNILLVFFNLYPFFLLGVWLFSTGRFLFPENTLIDYSLIYPFWYFAFLMMQCLLFFVIIDVIKIPFLFGGRRRRIKIFSIQARVVLLLVIFFAIYNPARMIYDYYTVSIRPVELKVKNLPSALNGFKITFIADMQADRYTDDKRLQNFIDKVNSTHPDLVLNGGDVITSTPEFIHTAAEYLGMIKSKYGVYSCLGDHDHWAYREDVERSIREVKAALSAYNIKMISNRNLNIPVNGTSIKVTFITNTYPERIKEPDYLALIKDSSTAGLKILLIHQPNTLFAQEAADNGYNLFLAGHTHGGQVTFLFPFMNLSPTLFETEYVRGDFHFGNMLMIITRGLGMSLVPLRINSTPEITVIKLVQR